MPGPPVRWRRRTGPQALRWPRRYRTYTYSPNWGAWSPTISNPAISTETTDELNAQDPRWFVDPDVQAWAPQPPTVAPFDPASAGPWSNLDEGELFSPSTFVVDDTIQAWAVRPALNAVIAQAFNQPEDEPYATVDDDARQAYAIQPPAAAAFNPGAGFPWNQDQGERFVASGDVADPDLAVAFGTPEPTDLTFGEWSGTYSNAVSAFEFALGGLEVQQTLVIDDTAQAYAVQPPAVAAFNPASGFPWNMADAPVVDQTVRDTTAEDATPGLIPPVLSAFTLPSLDELQAQPGADDTGQPWSVTPPQNAVQALAFNTPDEAPFAPVVDDTLPALTIQPPAYIPVFQATAWTGDPENWQQLPVEDPSVQSWAVQPPLNADRMTAWADTTELAQQQPVVDDTLPGWSGQRADVVAPFDPSTGFPWTTDDSVGAAAAGTDDTVQSWAVSPPSFDPAGFPWAGRDDIVQPVWTIADDTSQAWTPQPPFLPGVFNQPEIVAPAPWIVDAITSTSFNAAVGAVTVTYPAVFGPRGIAAAPAPAGQASAPGPQSMAPSDSPTGEAAAPAPSGTASAPTPREQ